MVEKSLESLGNFPIQFISVVSISVFVFFNTPLTSGYHRMSGGGGGGGGDGGGGAYFPR